MSDSRPLFDRFVTVEMDDVSTAASAFTVSPVRGILIEIRAVLHSAITTDDADITVEINGTAVTGAGFTVAQSGSAAGDTFLSNPTAANSVEPGDVIEVISDGASSTAARMTFVLVIREV